jgi:hypothetical protein
MVKNRSEKRKSEDTLRQASIFEEYRKVRQADQQAGPRDRP